MINEVFNIWVASFGWIMFAWFIIGNIIINGKYFIRLSKIGRKKYKQKRLYTKNVS